jgi:6-phosphogluconolactonase
MTVHPSPRVEVHESAQDLATSVAGAFVRLVADCQASGEIPQVALTGGTIAEAIHREIARLAADSDVDWSRVDFFWGDERYVAPDSPDRNAGQARAAFLDLVGVDPARIHEVPSTADADTVEAAASSYSEVVRSVGAGRFHLTVLGVGPDGHVASLFPGFPQLDVDDDTDWAEVDDLVTESYRVCAPQKLARLLDEAESRASPTDGFTTRDLRGSSR